MIDIRHKIEELMPEGYPEYVLEAAVEIAHDDNDFSLVEEAWVDDTDYEACINCAIRDYEKAIEDRINILCNSKFE